MKKITIICALAVAALVPFAAAAQEYVQGYTKQDGTYVQGYMRSSPNDTKADNYSTRGNVNPYTGQPGTRSPDPETVQPIRPLPNPYAPPPAPNPYGSSYGNGNGG
jgi:hypothetical protein